jgi:hypothetical protein
LSAEWMQKEVLTTFSCQGQVLLHQWPESGRES